MQEFLNKIIELIILSSGIIGFYFFTTAIMILFEKFF